MYSNRRRPIEYRAPGYHSSLRWGDGRLGTAAWERHAHGRPTIGGRRSRGGGGQVKRRVTEVSAAPETELAAAPVLDPVAIEAVAAELATKPSGGLMAAADLFTVARGAVMRGAAERYRLPVICRFRPFAGEGGLMSYGPDRADIFRRSAAYVDHTLKGADPAHAPVQQPTKLELTINVQTAAALGLAVSAALLACADAVIE